MESPVVAPARSPEQVLDMIAFARARDVKLHSDHALSASRTFAVQFAHECTGLRAGLADTLVAALALRLSQHPSVYRLQPAAAALVQETDLETPPGCAPQLLSSAFFVCCGSGGTLHGDATGIGGFAEGETISLFDWRNSGRLTVYPWKPRWGVSLAATLPCAETSVVTRRAIEAARFSVVFGLLLEAGNSPLLVTTAQEPFGSIDEVSVDKRATRRSSRVIGGYLRWQQYGTDPREAHWVHVPRYRGGS